MSSRKNERNGSTVATTYEFQFPQPKEKVPFLKYIYNSKEGTFCGRDASSWYREPEKCARNSSISYGTFRASLTDDRLENEGIGEGIVDGTESCAKLLLFYLVFYAVLAGLFAISMQGLFATLSDKEPRWKLDSSLIGTNPGLGYRPLAKETERGAIIGFETNNNETQQYWIGLLNAFLEPYLNKSVVKGVKQRDCDFGTKLGKDEVCIVDLLNTGDCTKNNSYGYDKQKPCVFLKLNKIFDWEPLYYDDPSDLPEDMPDDLVKHIKSLNATELKQVWVSCGGLGKHDEDFIQNFEYPSLRGFPSYYYPFKNTDGYLSPLVPVQINLKHEGYNTLVGIECRAWAKNIIYSPSIRDRKGSVAFQLLIDYKK